MLELNPQLYGCSIVINIDDCKLLDSKKQERWELWKHIRDKCLIRGNDCNKLTGEILNIDNLQEFNSKDVLNYVDDMLECNCNVKFYGENNIYGPIGIDFYSDSYPPLKWCEYMKNKGFMISCLFVELDVEDNKNICGKGIYNNSRVIEEIYNIPYDSIDMNHLEDLFNNKIQFKCYRFNLDRIKEYIMYLFNEEGICEELSTLLDLHGLGPYKFANKYYNNKLWSYQLEVLEDKLERGLISEGLYLDNCNKLKEKYELSII